METECLYTALAVLEHTVDQAGIEPTEMTVLYLWGAGIGASPTTSHKLIFMTHFQLRKFKQKLIFRNFIKFTFTYYVY